MRFQVKQESTYRAPGRWDWSMRIEPAGFRDHKDEELVMLESLVGREPPFMKSGTYPANKY